MPDDRPTPAPAASPAPSTARRAFRLATAPAGGVVRLARGVERRGRKAATDGAIALIGAVLAAPETERIAAAIADHEGTGKIIDRVTDSPAADRLIRHAIDSGLLDTALERTLEREQLWNAVDEIARSPAVSEAIAHQSRSAVNDVVDGVRVGSRRADAWLERVARRVTPGKDAE